MTNLQASRTRVITWEDPIAAVQTGKMISGIAYLKALQSGELPPPPIAVLMDMWITEVSEGRVVFAAEPAEYHYNPLGTVHGGVVSYNLCSPQEQAIPLSNSRSTTCDPLQRRQERCTARGRSFTLEDASPPPMAA